MSSHSQSTPASPTRDDNSQSELSNEEEGSPQHELSMDAYLARLREAISVRDPWCGGYMELPAHDLVLFYAAKDSSSGLVFSSVSAWTYG